ncbi:DEKNAAC103023 [Brettanomyces naardenensis]|uniref:DEKNAAC103023 n=1 Tax=Brettanomyces naardenensis TaxID=13370 RepID=A0A448YM27_BRENA|nr:DEKNAAC103023 [Brettanomyces naardenensis]
MKKARIIKPICLVGALLLPVSIGLMTLLGCSENVGYAVGFQILLGVSVGLNFQGPMMSALVNAPKTPGSSILTTAFIQFGRTTATALFSLIASAIYTSALKTGIIKITPQWQETKYAPGDVVIQMGLLDELNSHDKMLLQKEILVGVRNTFWLALGMSFVALVLTLCMSSKRVPKPGEVEA